MSLDTVACSLACSVVYEGPTTVPFVAFTIPCVLACTPFAAHRKGRKSERDHYQREESVAEAKELEVVQRPVWTARPDNDLWLAIEEATMLIKAKNYPTSNLKMRQLAL